MILRNPYGYLIKHFKLIHLILVVIYIYLAIKVNSIFLYYQHFIGGTASKLDAMSYVNQYYLFFIALSIIVCIILYAVMRYKKKPRLLYFLLIVFYLVVGGMIYFSYQGLYTISISVLETKNLLLYRDLLRILLLAQYVSIAFVMVRALGFDIKKFNFVQDLNELNLNETDTEEIEVTLGGSESIFRNLRRHVREFKYYYIENKTFIFIIGIVVVLIALSGITVHKEVVAKVYQEGDVFSSSEYRFQVLNTYVTSKDYQNQTFVNGDTTFVIVRMKLGVNHSARDFNTASLILKLGNHSYSNNNRYSLRFNDLGYAYKGDIIQGEDVYLFIYNIDRADASKKMMLEYAGDKTVRLNPVFLDEVQDSVDYQLTNKIDLSQTSFHDGYFVISSYELQQKFSYSYQYDVMGKQYTGNLTISSDNGLILHLLIDNSIPGDFTKNMGNASKIWFEITIRNQRYQYYLK